MKTRVSTHCLFRVNVRGWSNLYETPWILGNSSNQVPSWCRNAIINGYLFFPTFIFIRLLVYMLLLYIIIILHTSVVYLVSHCKKKFKISIPTCNSLSANKCFEFFYSPYQNIWFRGRGASPQHYSTVWYASLCSQRYSHSPQTPGGTSLVRSWFLHSQYHRES